MGGSSEFTLSKGRGPAVPPGPAELVALIESDAATRERTWARFLRSYSDDILRACRSVAREHDAAMDHYAHVLEALRRDDFRRLRGYRPDGRTRFTTWLSVVCRRLCVDRHRSLNGRTARGEEPSPGLSLRRKLQRMAGEDVAVEELPGRSRAPDAQVRQRELSARLTEARASLSEEDRLLLALRFEDEASVREIADLMEFPSVFHVYRRLNKALGQLRSIMESNGIEDPEP